MTVRRMAVVAFAVCASAWVFASSTQASVLVVDDFGFVGELHTDTGDESSAPVIAHTHADAATFNAMSAAALDVFDAIYLNDRNASSFLDITNANLASVIGEANVPGAGRVYLSTHDAVGHSTLGAISLIRNSVAWAAAGSAAETNRTGLVVFWENDVEIPPALPASWGLALDDHAGDEVDILAAFDGLHPIYTGGFGPVTDEFNCPNDTTLNWCTGHHTDFTAFNSAIFTASELDTETDDWTGLVRDPAPGQQNGGNEPVIPEPATMLLLGLGGLGTGFVRRRKGTRA